MPDCSDIRKQWDEAFDADHTPAPTVLQHLNGCGDCRDYALGATRALEVLRDLPLGAVNEAADQAILAALRVDRAPVPVRRPVLPLVFAGAGSFALTLIVAGVMLSAASGTPAGGRVPAPSGIARTPIPDSNAELDAWLDGPGPLTGARARMPINAPAPPERLPVRGQSCPPQVTA